MRSAAFLDRDGVINAMVATAAGIDSPQHPDQFQLQPGAAEAIRSLNQLGLRVIVVSNQPGVAKGKSTLELLEATTAKMHQLLEAAGARLDAVYYCLHHPQARLDEYRVPCECRKPEPGLITRAGSDHGIDLALSFMVGDQPTDVLAGRRAGCRTVGVGGDEAHFRAALPDQLAADLGAAVEWIRLQHLPTPPALVRANVPATA